MQKKNQKKITGLPFFIVLGILYSHDIATMLPSEETNIVEEPKRKDETEGSLEKLVELPDSSIDFDFDETVNEEKLYKEEEETEKELLRKDLPLSSHMSEFLQPWDPATEHEVTRVNFQNASLSEFMLFIENTYQVTFLTDEALDPLTKDSPKLSANTIHFKSHSPLNKKELWDLFTTFLDMAGFALVPGNNPRIFKVVSADPKISNKMSLPSYIGVDYTLLPDNDAKIRYVYFVANADTNNLLPVIDSMRSAGSSPVLTLPEMRAIILTDKSSLIKSIMKIVSELDTAASPEVMSIVRLKKATASKVAVFYEALTKEEQPNSFMARMQKKNPVLHHFHAFALLQNRELIHCLFLGHVMPYRWLKNL